jgi:uncharacterized membrane protein
MKNITRIKRGLFVFGTLFAISCSTPKKTATVEEACASPAPSYTAAIKGIIESKCSVDGCHSNGKGDFRVFENLKHEADEGEIMKMVVTKKVMPPGNPLPADQIKLINCWLKDGAKMN